MANQDLTPIADAITVVAARVQDLESQITNTPVRYTVAGCGFLTAASLVAATSVSLSTIPTWQDVNELWIIIDVGTDEAEIRKITGISGMTASFSGGLAYAHAEDDPVLFLDKPFLNVKYWGAKGDGVTNDDTAVRRVIAQLAALGGGIMYIPGGTYLMSGSGSITIPDYSTIEGEGWISIIKTSASQITIGSYNILRNFKLQANAANSLNIALFANGETRNLVDHVWIYGQIQTLELQASSYTIIRDCLFEPVASGAPEYQININSACSYITVEDCVMTGGNTVVAMVRHDGSNNFHLRGCTITGKSTTNYIVNVSGSSQFVFINENRFATSDGYGIYLGTSSYITVGKNVITSCGSYGLYTVNCDYVTITGNQTGGHNTGSSYDTDSEYVSYAGNIFTEAAPKQNVNSSPVFLHDRLWWYVHVEDFVATLTSGGYPAMARVGAANEDPNVWVFTNGATEAISSWVPVEGRMHEAQVEIWYAYSSPSDQTGNNFRAAALVLLCNDGTSVIGASTAYAATIPGAGADELQTAKIGTIQMQSLSNFQIMRLRVQRSGAHADDTATDDFRLHGVIFVVNR